VNIQPHCPWTADQVAELASLWNNGISGGKIAEHFSAQFGYRVSRNAVIGKVSRLHLMPRRVRRNAEAPKRKSQSKPTKSPFGSFLKQRAVSAAEVPHSQRRTLMELGPHHCRWPYGEPGTPSFFFCGAQREWWSSYCAAHIGASVGKSAVAA
jgi:GcrA cell cycle regulator